MFASFLQQASRTLEIPALGDTARDMTAVGDLWREFALLASRTCKGRAPIEKPYDRLAEILNECADRETEILTAVRRSLP
jgi:hypothetical protein